MTDIVERLRDLQDHYSTSGQLGPGNQRIFGVAADEIERLRAKGIRLIAALDDMHARGETFTPRVSLAVADARSAFNIQQATG